MNVGLKSKIHDDAWDVDMDHVKKGKNNIKIGKIKVCEHTTALKNGIGLHADFKLSVNNFPNFDEGIRKVLTEIAPVLIEK